MKKSILFLVLFALVFFSFQAFAVDSFPAGTKAFTTAVTADTKAVEAKTDPWTWKGFLHSVVYPALTTGLLSLLAWATTAGVKLLNAYLKQLMHFKGSSVVADAITEVIAIMGAEITKALADGKLSDAERTAIKDKARVLILDRLNRLSGFGKSNLIAWVDEQMDIGLGKLLLKVGLKPK